jgi:hypothetical protein
MDLDSLKAVLRLLNRSKTGFMMQMAFINRKQVPLCKSHHISLNGNKLTEAEIIAFKEGVENFS